MKTKLSAIGMALLILPCAALAWSGDTWGNITRATIQSNADLMIDSTWVPKNTFTNWAYGSTSITYTKGVVYTGVAYSQTYNIPGMVQQDWTEFSNAVTNTSGGTVAYGNDCSGFTSICWRLPTREVTATFESQIGTYWISLGATGTAATASLLLGDALNSATVGHIVMFLDYESGGVRTMEQTPNNAQRKVRSFSNLAAYRPIRRLLISDAPMLSTAALSRVVDAGNAVSLSVSPSGTTPFTYRWQFNGNNVAGATTSQLTFSAAQLSNAGNYVCVVTNVYGSATSSVMSLTVYPAQTTVFLDSFDTNTASQWLLNKSSTDTRVTFNYDYSGLGIPSAPHSTGGTTRGLRMEANMTAGVVAAVSLSPTNRSFAGDYRLRFDLWMNANGPFPAGGAGSTQHATAGVGTAGNRVEWTGTGSTADGYWFAADGEGQASDTSTTSGDYCAFAGASLQGSTSGVYQAGTNSTDKGNTDPYYVGAFPTGLAAPAAQQTNYTQQTGACAAGTIGFAWHEIIVARRGSTVDWAIDGIRLATITNAAFTASNVFVGYWDMFASLSDNTNLSFGLVDNVRVEVPVTAPSITAQPQNQTVVQGANATFSVAANGMPAPGYQWRFNGANLVGATASTCTVTNAQPINAGTYSVVVTNVAGSLTNSAVLIVLVPPTITAQPQGQTNLAGTSATLSVTASGTGPLCYLWQCNGSSYPPGTNTLVATLPGNYSVVVSNVAGMLTSAVATVVFTYPPPAHPGHFDSICLRADGALQLSMSGDAGGSYIVQWTSDWVAWSNLCTLSGTNGQFMWVDLCATNGGPRFYRMRVSP